MAKARPPPKHLPQAAVRLMADSPWARAPGGADTSRGAAGTGAGAGSARAGPAGAGPAGAGLAAPVAPTNALSSERYLAWLYSTPEQQPVLTVLCQIEAEVAASLRQGVEHHVAHARLQWWRDECARAAEGSAVHPLTRELVRAVGSRLAAAVGSPTSIDAAAANVMPSSATNAGVVSSSAASGNTATSRIAGAVSGLAGISGFVDAAVWDLAGATFETRKELTAYCERWSAAMFATAVQGRGSESTSSRSLQIRALGAAVREVELLAGLAREAHAGRIRVPLDELERAGVEVSSLAKAPWPAALVNLLRERHESLRNTIAAGVAQFGRDEQASIRGLLVWAALAWRLSQRAQRALPHVLQPRQYHALADGWYAWRAAHRASAGRLRLNS